MCHNSSCRLARLPAVLLAIVVTAPLSACGLVEPIDVTGTLAGLEDGSSLTLKLDSDNYQDSRGALTLTQNGDFAFEQQVHGTDQSWTVEITTQPDSQSCSPTSFAPDALGNGADAIDITCTSTDVELKGTVTNLAEGTTLVLAATPTNEDLTVTQQGSIAFLQTVSSSDDWTVTIKTQPDGYTCIATDGDSAGYSAANDDPPDGLNFDCSTPSG